MPNVLCPICGKDDRVRKVSGIPGDPRLAIPSRPILPEPDKREEVFGAIFTFGALGMAGLGLATNLRSLGFELLIALCFGVGLFFWFSSHNKIQRFRQETYKHYKDEIWPRWKIACARWGRLYLCERDDVVFDPDEKTHAPAAFMHELLDGTNAPGN